MFAAHINNRGAVVGTVRIRGGITRSAVWRGGKPQWLTSAPDDTRVSVNLFNGQGNVVGQALGTYGTVGPGLSRDGAMVDPLSSTNRVPALGASPHINRAGVRIGWIQDRGTCTFLHDISSGRAGVDDLDQDHLGRCSNDAGDVLIQAASPGRNHFGRDTRASVLPRLANAGGDTAYGGIDDAGRLLCSRR